VVIGIGSQLGGADSIAPRDAPYTDVLRRLGIKTWSTDVTAWLQQLDGRQLDTKDRSRRQSGLHVNVAAMSLDRPLCYG